MKKPLIALGLLVVLALGAWAWMHQRDKGHDGMLVLYGNVDIRQVSLAFDGSGRVAEMKVDEGDAVKTGQVLATLDTRTLALQVEQAQAQIGVQQQNLLRLKNGARPQELAQARSRLSVNAGQDPTLFAGEVAVLVRGNCWRSAAAELAGC